MNGPDVTNWQQQVQGSIVVAACQRNEGSWTTCGAGLVLVSIMYVRKYICTYVHSWPEAARALGAKALLKATSMFRLPRSVLVLVVSFHPPTSATSTIQGRNLFCFSLSGGHSRLPLHPTH